jgi:ABC-type uncharacterized transport system ATPase subunit
MSIGAVTQRLMNRIGYQGKERSLYKRICRTMKKLGQK